MFRRPKNVQGGNQQGAAKTPRRSMTAQQMLGQIKSVAPQIVQKAEQTIEKYRPMVEQIVNQLLAQLPAKDELDSLKIVIVILLIDLSGSESGNEEYLAMAHRIVVEQLLQSPLKGSTIFAAVGFHTQPFVIQPFKRVMNWEDQVWLTHDMDTVDEDYHDYTQTISADGPSTDINLALVAALQAGMTALGYYASEGGLPKLLVYTETDGGQNGPISADEAGAFLQAAEGKGNVKIGFVAIGDPYTKRYVTEQLGLPEGNVKEVLKTAESIMEIGYHVSGSVQSMSQQKGNLQDYDLWPEVLEGEKVRLIELQDDAGSNAFGNLTALEELALDEEELGEGDFEDEEPTDEAFDEQDAGDEDEQ